MNIMWPLVEHFAKHQVGITVVKKQDFYKGETSESNRKNNRLQVPKS